MKAKDLIEILEKSPEADVFVMVEKKPYRMSKGKIIRPKGSERFPQGAYYFVSRSYEVDSIRPFRKKTQAEEGDRDD